MYQNLHSHTFNSDGLLSHRETLETCAQNRIGIVAFTDHDTLIDEKNWEQLKNSSSPTKWVSGIEISSGLPRELGGKPTSMFHIVGLFVNPFDRELTSYCLQMQEARRERAGKIVANLQKIGFKITLDDCEKEAHGKTINRPHICSSLWKIPENRKLIYQLKESFDRECLKNEGLAAIHRKLLNERDSRWAYHLFLKEESYLPQIYVGHQFGLEMDRVVRLIRGAGGLAFLAHWSFCKKFISLELVEKFLKEKRLDGAEVVFGAINTQGITDEILADMEKMKSLTEKYGSFQSGGADSHQKKDLITFTRKTDFVTKTENLIENMTARTDFPKESLRWSSL